jgi:hypothetical protein
VAIDELKLMSGSPLDPVGVAAFVKIANEDEELFTMRGAEAALRSAS